MISSALKIFSRFFFTLLGGSILIFFLLRILPGDPAAIALGVTASPEAIAAKREELGLNASLIHQYFSWVFGLIQGNFGISMTSGADLSPIIIDRAQVSAILISLSMFLALIIAIPLGLFAAQRNSILFSILTSIGVAIPSFLFAILGIGFFSLQLGWLPASGWIPPNQGFSAFLIRLILPAFSLALVQAAIISRYIRSSALDIIHHDYVRTAYATGAGRIETLFRYILPNIIIPTATITAVQLASLVAGAVIIERVFFIPGIGSLLLDSLANRDIMAVQTLIMLLITVCLVVNFCVDCIALLIDPRSRS